MGQHASTAQIARPQRSGVPSARDAVLQRYLPLVRRVARRLLGRVTAPVDLDDLVSWGMLGLLDALEKYEPAREALFSTYARIRIRGAILDELRDLDWAPRRVREKAATIERTADALEAKLGRPAREEELARALGVSLATYRALRVEIAPQSFVSLHAPGRAGGSDELPVDRAHPDPLGDVLRRERLHLVAEAIRRLPDRDQLVLSLYYRDELTMREVGAVLGLTESRVSQLHTQALLRLRAHLGAEPEPAAQAG